MAPLNHGLPDPNSKAKSSMADVNTSGALQRRPLTYQDGAKCPICRHGKLEGMAMMDAFACQFCRHIFSADLENQVVRVEDSSQSLAWRWNGYNWQPANRLDSQLTLPLWLGGGLLALVPPLLIGLSSYTFPPLPGSVWAWLPPFWIALTFSLHLSMVAWVLVEHYQWPLYVSWKIRIQDWLSRQ